MPLPSHEDLLVGTSTGDDAAVWRVSADRALVATVDFFAPVVDDARTWGAIAAANSASDVYAMGGRPLFALNVCGWPLEKLSLDLLGDVLEGASEVATRGGWMVVGGHTIDSPEPLYGQCVMGEVHPDRIMTNDRARPGQVIILTKALGTGVISTAVKRLGVEATAPGGSIADAYAAAVASMIRLNDDGSRIATAAGVRAATDITGFGLAGHLHKVALGSGLAIEIDVHALPLLPGAVELVADGFVPGGTERNLEFVGDHLRPDSSLDWPRWSAIVADPQTSGGLALCVEAARAPDMVAELRAVGHPAAIIGRTLEGPAGRVTVAER